MMLLTTLNAFLTNWIDDQVDDFMDGEENNKNVLRNPYTSTSPLGYEKLENARADGTTIFEINGTEDECIAACTTDSNCVGFEHATFDNHCWLKTGSFWDTTEFSETSTVFIQHKSADFQPIISTTADVNFVYDHYDYLRPS